MITAKSQTPCSPSTITYTIPTSHCHTPRYHSISFLHSSHIGSSPTSGFLLQNGHKLSATSSSNMLFTPFNSSKHTLQYSSVCAIQFSPQRGHFLYFIRFSVSVVLQYDCAQIIATFVTKFSAQPTRQAKRTSLLRHPFDGTFLFVIGAVTTSIILVVARFTCRAKSP